MPACHIHAWNRCTDALRDVARSWTGHESFNATAVINDIAVVLLQHPSAHAPAPVDLGGGGVLVGDTGDALLALGFGSVVPEGDEGASGGAVRPSVPQPFRGQLAAQLESLRRGA